MKLNVALLFVCVALATATNLRGDSEDATGTTGDNNDTKDLPEPPKTLLKRCLAKDATPASCCNFQSTDHALYQRHNVYDFKPVEFLEETAVWFWKKKPKKEPVNPEDEPDEDEPKKKGFFGKIGSGLKNLGSKVAQGVKKVTNFVGDKVDSGLVHMSARKPACCNQGIGMWMPTDEKSDHKQFCRTQFKEDVSKTQLEVVNDLTSKFQSSLDSLVSTKNDLKKEFKQLYIAHEKTEGDADAKNEQKEKEIQLEKNKIADKKVEIEDLKGKLAEVEKQQQENIEKMKALVDGSLKKVKAAQKELSKYQKLAEEKEKIVEEAKEALEKCMGDNTKAREKLQQLTEDLASARAKVRVTQALLIKRQAEYDEVKKAQEEDAKGLAEQLKAAQAEEQEFKATYAESRKALEEAQAEFVEAQTKANEMLMSPPALLETEGEGNDAQVQICDEECEEMKAWKVDDYLAGDFDESKTLLDKATNYVGKQMKNMHSMFNLLKQTQKRVSQLKDLDVKLHKEIMEDIRKENKRLAAKLERVQKKMQRLIERAESLEKKVKALQDDIEKYTDDMESKVQENMRNLAKTQQQIQDAMMSLVNLQGQLTRATVGEADCKSIATGLRKRSKEAKEATEKANKAAADSDKKLKESEQAILDLKVAGEIAKVQGEAEIKAAQDNMQALKIKADQNDDKTKRLKIATKGLNAATAATLPADDVPESPATTPAPTEETTTEEATEETTTEATTEETTTEAPTEDTNNDPQGACPFASPCNKPCPNANTLWGCFGRSYKRCQRKMSAHYGIRNSKRASANTKMLRNYQRDCKDGEQEDTDDEPQVMKRVFVGNGNLCRWTHGKHKNRPVARVRDCEQYGQGLCEWNAARGRCYGVDYNEQTPPRRI